MFLKNRFKRYQKQGSLVLSSPFLTPLSLSQRYEFLQFCHRRRYKEGEYIYYQNDPGTGMYFIESGRVELIVQSSRNDGTQEEILYELNQPDHFGNLSIGYELRRKSSARCLSDCVLLGFFNPDFETLKKRHPVIAVRFLETLSTQLMGQLEKTNQKLEEETDSYTAYSFLFSTYEKQEKEPV